MKFVLNMGMHKTGSSSIQQSLNGLDTPDAAYVKIGHPNHSSIYMTLFRDAPETYNAHRKNNRTREEVMELQKRFEATFTQFVAAHPGKTILSSAEDVGLMQPGELARMKDWLLGMFDEVVIVGYARAPISFMRSAIQQRVAGGVNFKPADLFPPYRDRFEKFDDVFGRDAVKLTKFGKEHLTDGDVVTDFLHKAGLGHLDVQTVTDNLSRPLEATSVLYVQRRLGRGFVRYPKAPLDNARMVDLLREVGTSKVELHPDYVSDQFAAHQDDLDWMAQRLGVPFADQARDVPGALRGPEDLIDIASQNLGPVLNVLAHEAAQVKTSDPELVAKAVDLLLDLVRYRRENPNA